MVDIRPNDVEFTQYLMPDGRKTSVRIERSEAVATRAKEIVAAGFRFELEMLSDYKTVSLTIADDKEDLAIEVVPNGPGVLIAVDRLVANFKPDSVALPTITGTAA